MNSLSPILLTGNELYSAGILIILDVGIFDGVALLVEYSLGVFFSLLLVGLLLVLTHDTKNKLNVIIGRTNDNIFFH